jgi:hypothetical protein
MRHFPQFQLSSDNAATLLTRQVADLVILYSDPHIKGIGSESRGPIVVHRNFPSLFFLNLTQIELGLDDSFSELLISWRTRYEEQYCRQYSDVQEIVTSVPNLTRDYSCGERQNFNNWRKGFSIPRFSILCLRWSGSMKTFFSQLVRAVNESTRIQATRAELITVHRKLAQNTLWV